MSKQLVQIVFQFNTTVEGYKEAAAKVAEHLAKLSGLQWKIWLINENKKEAGGIYLFENTAAVAEYKDSALFKGLQSNKSITSVSFKQFDIIRQLSEITHAPLNTPAKVL